MRRLRILLGSAIVAGWVGLASSGSAEAQVTGGSSAPAWSPIRSNWEQRVLGGDRSAAAGWQHWANQLAVKQQKAAQAPVRQVSATEVSATEVPATEVPATEVPETEVVAAGALVAEEEIIPDVTQPDLMPTEAATFGSEVLGGCGAGYGTGCGTGCGGGCAVGCGSCGDVGCGPCDVCCDPCWFGPPGCYDWGWVRRLSLFGGVQGFKGPPDFGINGNFGFHEGVNFGAPLGGPAGIGFQVGFQAVHSNLSGYQAPAGVMSRGDRDQFFVTGGLFRRALCGGVQWGGVFDYLHDSYYETVDVTQIRAELSWVDRYFRWELGFWGAFGTGDDEITVAVLDALQVTVQPTDLFAFFYRRQFCEGGQGRIWTGFTGEGDAMIGADCTVPIGASWAVEGNFNYVVPRDAIGFPGQLEEGWGIAIQLVWYPGRQSRCVHSTPFHPLLSVADNSFFMVHHE